MQKISKGIESNLILLILLSIVAGIMALLVMAKSSTPLIQIPVSGINAFSLIFWGFGIWWFVMSVIMTFHYIGRKALPYAMSWWAFVFPLGAYVGSSYMLYKVYELSPLNWIGFGLYWLLLFLWVITAWKTIVHLVKGDLFVPSQG